MDDARWLRLVRCHELEILLIDAQDEFVSPTRVFDAEPI